jgi:hypothetical protein
MCRLSGSHTMFSSTLCVVLLQFLCGWCSHCPQHACRVHDFWEGYKLFCYGYYSNSCQHESEFRASKLGLLKSTHPLCSCISYKLAIVIVICCV